MRGKFGGRADEVLPLIANRNIRKRGFVADRDRDLQPIS
jgi:hypothetical protein